MLRRRKISRTVRNNSRRMAVQFFAIAVLLLLFCSCLSFNIADWPSSFVYPHNRPTVNWCGPVGAALAYYLLYYIGPGIFVLLGCAMCFLIAQLFQKEVTQIFLRSAGVCLLTAAASASFYCLWPWSVYDFPVGSGGVLGVATTEFLRSHFAWLGTFLLILSVWVVGFALLADRMVLELLNLLGFGIKKVGSYAGPSLSEAKKRSKALVRIWKKLSARQTIQIPPVKPPDDADRPLVLQTSFDTAPGIKVSERQLIKQIPDRRHKDKRQYVQQSYDDYAFPPLSLLAEQQRGFADVQGRVVKSKAAALERLLGEFNINAHVVTADTGPVVTMFELQLAAGVKVSQISALANDMARALGVGAVRVVAPLPGKHTIGIEVPNSEKEKVRFKDMLQLAGSRPQRMQIPLYLGKDSAGEALVSDLTKMPHLLIAGTTGSGKSVCINSIITGILLTKRPDEVKLILVDPKMVEMTAFNNVPHLMCPIVTETQRAVQILEWATVKMDERYSLLAEAKVKNVAEYNRLGADEIIARFNPTSADEEAKIPKKLSYIVIIIDELADLMMTAPKEIEAYVVRLAQKSRAVGIHIVLATQRPQATVVTGLIKSNMPTRIGFRVAARMDSRIILDQNGAETLLGEGDMLFLKPGTSDLIRAQGTFVDEAEVKRIVKHLKEVAEPQFHQELMQLGRLDAAQMERDDLFDDAVRVILESQRGSVSLLQRRLSIGYARASRIIEMMAAAGVLGEYKGSQAREVLMTLDEYEKIREQMAADAKAGFEDLTEDADKDEHAYITEGQKGYIATNEVE